MTRDQSGHASHALAQTRAATRAREPYAMLALAGVALAVAVLLARCGGDCCTAEQRGRGLTCVDVVDETTGRTEAQCLEPRPPQ